MGGKGKEGGAGPQIFWPITAPGRFMWPQGRSVYEIGYRFPMRVDSLEGDMWRCNIGPL